MASKKSYSYLRLAAGTSAFLAFCFLVNGVFGPAWIPHVLIHGSDVRVLEEGIWLAKFCRMDGEECYLSTRSKAFEHAAFLEARSAIRITHQILSTLSLVGSLVCVTSFIDVMVVLSGDNKPRRRTKVALILAIIGSVLSVCSMVALFVDIRKAIKLSQTSSSWSLILAVTGTVLQLCALFFLAGYFHKLFGQRSNNSKQSYDPGKCTTERIITVRAANYMTSHHYVSSLRLSGDSQSEDKLVPRARTAGISAIMPEEKFNDLKRPKSSDINSSN